jgi:phospholipid/cholesterol/gamma-HCH transport system ATP-binding protein
MPSVAVEGVTKRFDGRTVLDGIDLPIDSGQIVAIMGSSGGGKTTLLKCIAGLIVPEEGKIEVDGIDVLANPEEARQHMGMVFQSAALFDFLSVRDNVLFGVRRRRTLSAKEAETMTAELLERVGLVEAADRLPSELSGGMKKRVGIARALALKPRVILYDEPTTGLDPVTAYTIDQLIVELRRDLGVTSLVVSHDVSSVFRVADRVAFLDKGKLVFDGAPDRFRESDHPAIRELIDRAEAKSL